MGWLQNVVRPDAAFLRVAIAVDGAALALGIYVFAADGPVGRMTAGWRFADVGHLGLVCAGGALVYGVALALALKLCGVGLPLRRRRR